jgi:uncharacterized glyoxalase superfamily protein PhnB
LAEITRLVQRAPRLRGRVRNSRPPDRGDARRHRFDGLFLYEHEVSPCPGISFTIQVDDVEAKHRELSAAGIAFVHPPMKVFWGYGAELCDPDGYRLRLWDQTTMREKAAG